MTIVFTEGGLGPEVDAPGRASFALHPKFQPTDPRAKRSESTSGFDFRGEMASRVSPNSVETQDLDQFHYSGFGVIVEVAMETPSQEGICSLRFT